MVRKILIFDENHPSRAALIETLERMAKAQVVLASNADEVVAKIREDFFGAVLVDTSLAGDDLPRVLDAVRLAPLRPLVLAVDNDPRRELDPDLISLVVRRPYEVTMVTGILLAAVIQLPHDNPADGDFAIRGQ